MRIDSVNTVREYADQGVPLGEERKLVIRNHWNYSDRVVIVLEGVEFVALARDLCAAIGNAQSAHTR